MKKLSLAVLLLITNIGLVFAQDIRVENGKLSRNKVLQMTRTETPPSIDGVMDEIWATATEVKDFHQLSPNEYAPPSEETIVRLLYDDNFLYVSAEMIYEDPSIIVANKLSQGSALRDEDKLRLLINPFNDGRNGYIFETNANGVRTEAIVENVRDFSFEWTGIWYAGSQRTDYGWFAEMAIPFKTISFDPNSDTWGMTFLRAVKGKNEDIVWTSENREVDPTNYGSAVGFSGLQQGIGLDVIPGLSLTRSESYDPNFSDTNWEPSLDVFYKFTPNLTGSLTFNSDFSATNVDSRQVQLTRFNLFVEEQRKFFLQEADIFEFGGIDRNGRPFFSRRIGIGPNNQQLDLDVGGKITGRIGDWNVGALAVRQGDNQEFVTEDEDLIDASDLFVGRVSRNVLEQSSVGVIATFGNPRADEDNSLVGVDFKYLNTRSFENVIIEGEFWYQQTDTEGIEGNDQAWGAKIISPNNEGYKGKLQYFEIEENFNPALGFVNRRGIKQFETFFGYVKRFDPDFWLVSLENKFSYDRTENMLGEVESELVELELVNSETQSGDVFLVLLTDNREVLTEPFEISDGVTIPMGDYSFKRYGVEIETAGQRDLGVTLTLEDGEFYSGDRAAIGVELEWLPNKYFTGVFGFEYNDIVLPEGSFDTQLFSLETDVAFNNQWSWINNIQYDNQSDLLGVNSRLQWIPRAGQEFYLIYNGGWLDEETNGFQKVGQSATIKLNYTYRF